MDKKPKCQYGAKCYRKNQEHIKNFYHPPSPNEKVDNHQQPKKPRLETPKIQTKLDIFKRVVKRDDVSPRTATQSPDKTKPRKDDVSPRTATPSPDKTKPRKDDVSPRTATPSLDKTKPRKDNVSPRTATHSPDKTKLTDNYTIEESDSDTDTEPSSGWRMITKLPDEPQVEPEKTQEPLDDADTIHKLFLVKMPQDFYQLFEFCKYIDDRNPSTVFKKFGLELVGPFDVLAGNLEFGTKYADKCVCHWRYFFDPPEFQTVLKGEKGFHIGYWRDSPLDEPVCLVNNSGRDCTINYEGGNIFYVVIHHLNNFIKTCDPFTKMSASKLLSKLETHAKQLNIKLDKTNTTYEERKKLVVSKTFHKFGIVVPVEKKTELGYRPLIETEANIKKTCKFIMDCSNEKDREKMYGTLQPLITAANIANDECDFGNSLELGIDLFSMGSEVFHETIRHLLTTAYSLLNRPEFEQIISVHLKHRRRGHNLSVFNIN